VRAVWLVAPVLAAGLVHVAVLKTGALSAMAVPLDGGRTLRERPLLGARKTWRGLLLMPAATALATSLQARLAGRLSPRATRWVGASPGCGPRPWLVGAVLGFGYCAAELPNSFVKRQLGVPAGGSAARLRWLQYAVDQADSVAGCMLALRLVCRRPAGELAAAAALGTGAHVAVERLMHAVGLRAAASPSPPGSPVAAGAGCPGRSRSSPPPR
jgi:CDP-archaeol synthase